MGAAKNIKAAMLYKNIKQKDFAVEIGRDPQIFYNMLSRDVFRWSEAEKIADALGCDIVFRDRETGQLY